MTVSGRIIVDLYCSWAFPVIGFFQTFNINSLFYWFLLGFFIDAARFIRQPTKRHSLNLFGQVPILIISVPVALVLIVIIATVPNLFEILKLDRLSIYISENSFVLPSTKYSFSMVTCVKHSDYAHYSLIRCFSIFVYAFSVLRACTKDPSQKTINTNKASFGPNGDRRSNGYYVVAFSIGILWPVVLEYIPSFSLICGTGIGPIAQDFLYYIMEFGYFFVAMYTLFQIRMILLVNLRKPSPQDICV